jgi:hypothetical protein
MRRREFIAGLGSTAAWPLAARAQQGDRVWRIGVLWASDENDPRAKAGFSAFAQALAGLGWTDGRNVRMDLRWHGDDTNRIREVANELVGLQPDIIVTGNTPATVAVQRETRTIPIVFAGAGNPVASGIVERVNQPGGNITGFALFEPTLGGKWLELLSEIAPGLRRASFMFNPDTAIASIYMPSLETAARSLKVEPIIAHIRNGHHRPGARAGWRPCCRAGWVHSRTYRADHIGGGPKQRPGGFLAIRLCQKRRLALLRTRRGRHRSSCRLLCRSHSEVFRCDDCGFETDRDVNAAMNLARYAASSAVLSASLGVNF